MAKIKEFVYPCGLCGYRAANLIESQRHFWAQHAGRWAQQLANEESKE